MSTLTAAATSVEPTNCWRRYAILFAAFVMALGGVVGLSGPAEASTVSYYLPYTNGYTAVMTQGPGGGTSHNNIYNQDAYDFDLNGGAVRASAPGTIVSKVTHIQGFTTATPGGNAVVIKHADNTCTRYAHMAYGSVTTKTVGQSVGQAEKLGNEGGTGYVYGNHLHFQRENCSNITTPVSFVENNWTSQNSGVVLPADTDGDGLLDEDDQCPSVDGNGSTTGCPTVKGIDLPTSTTSTGGFVVFARGTDNKLYHTWQPSAGSGWVGWQSPVSGANLTAPPAIYKGPNGAFTAFAINSSGRLITSWQTSAGSSWTSWTQIAGSGATLTGTPVVNTTSTGGLVVFACGTDNKLYHTWQATPGSGWEPWELVTAGAQVGGTPAIYRAANGTLSAYTINSVGALMSTWQSSPGGTWASWTQIGGASETLTGVPVVQLSSTGGLVVFARGTDGKLYNTWQTSAGSSWAPIDDVVGGGALASSPQVHKGQNGAFTAFAINSSGRLITSWQTSAGSSWTSWTTLGGTNVTVKAIPSVHITSTGGLVVFAQGTDNKLYHTWQPSAGSSWVAWDLVVDGGIIG